MAAHLITRRCASVALAWLSDVTDKKLLAVYFSSAFLLLLAWIFGTQGLKGLEVLPLAPMMGFVAAFFLLHREKSQSFLYPWERHLISLSSLFFIAPQNWVTSLCMTAIGLILIFKKEDNLVSLGQISIGLAWISLWGSLLLLLLGPWLLNFEAWLAFIPLKMLGDYKLASNAIYGASGHSVVLFAPCSAFNNTIRTAFIWLCLLKLCEARSQKQQAVGLLLALAFVVVLNCIRIGLMAKSYEGYVFWHDGSGALVYTFLMTFGVFVFFYLSANYRRIVTS